MNLTPIAHSIMLAQGWRRAAIAFIAGALSVTALAPINFWPVLFVTFPVAVWIIDGAVAGRLNGALSAAVAGWCFGFGYFLAGVYWVGYAFLVDAKTFGWLLPIAVGGLPAYLALFTAFGFGLARLLWIRGPLRILALAIALTVGEWLRGHVLTGFPWNAFGYALTEPLALAQSVTFLGIWGLTFVAVAVFATPALFADERVDTPHPWRWLIACIVILAALTGYGSVRIWLHPTSYVKNVKLRIMQPNLQQDEKFNYAAKDAIMERYLRLSDRATGPSATGIRDITHLIWPESAFPFFLTHEPEALKQIADLLPPGTVLITGAIRAPETASGREVARAYNSVYVIDNEGAILGIYDKIHLVPFGEYLPFQDFLERLGLTQLTKIRGGFIAGDRRRSLDVPGAPPTIPLICYEAIFPEEAVPSDQRPGWLVNVTNDAWFGISSGPYQHFQQARVLAIAESLPLVRAANNGVSAVIDPVGRIIRSLPLGAEGILDSPLPAALPPTLFARVGELPAYLLLAIAAVVVLRRRFQH